MADHNQNKTHNQDKYQYRCVMLVDDNEIDNIINEKIIEANNFAEKILVFQTGADSLKYLLDNQHDIESLPEIIFLDINMPVMDGFQYLEEFEKYNNNVKEKCRIIMLSSSISPRDIDRAASNIHVKKYLNKPLNIRYLSAITV
jgi:response regulator RpfG family c-di-GMP phosphodiesterase